MAKKKGATPIGYGVFEKLAVSGLPRLLPEENVAGLIEKVDSGINRELLMIALLYDIRQEQKRCNSLLEALLKKK